MVTWINKKSNKELGATLKAIDNELDSTLQDIKGLEKEFILHTSTGRFLDEHGEWYGFPRKIQESDEAYRARIWREINRTRLTIPAIREEVEAILPEGSYVTIVEPYSFIFKLNVGKLSDDFLLRDNAYASHNVIDIRINGPINVDIIGLVEELRSAGIKVHISGEYMDSVSIADNVNDIGRSWYEVLTELICHRNWEDGFVLNYSLLGDTGAYPSAGGTVWFYPEMTIELTMPTFPHSGLFPKIPTEYLESLTPTFLNNVHLISDENPISGVDLTLQGIYEDIYLDSLFMELIAELDRNRFDDDTTDIGTPTWDDITLTLQSKWLGATIDRTDDATVELTIPLRLGSGYLPDLPDKYKNIIKNAFRPDIDALGDNDFVVSGGSTEDIYEDEDLTIDNAGAYRLSLHTLSGVNPLSGIPSGPINIYASQYLGGIYSDRVLEITAPNTGILIDFAEYLVETELPKAKIDMDLVTEGADHTTVELGIPLRLGSGYMPALPDKYKNLVKNAMRTDIELLGDSDYVTSGGSTTEIIEDNDLTIDNAGAFRTSLHGVSGVNPLSGIASSKVETYTSQYLGVHYVDCTVEMKVTSTNTTNFDVYEPVDEFSKLNLDAKPLSIDVEKEVYESVPIFTETVSYAKLHSKEIYIQVEIETIK